MIRISDPKRFVVFVSVVFIICLAFVSGVVWGRGKVLKSGAFEIQSGKASSQVWDQLQIEGYTSRTFPWKFYAWKQGVALSIQAGTYQLQQNENIQDVVRRFSKGDDARENVAVTYPEGFTLEQIAVRTASTGISTKEEFISVAVPSLYRDEFSFLRDPEVSTTLEGYLFPDTYKLSPTDSPRDVVSRMLSNFRAKVSDDLLRDAAESGRTLNAIIIMASIIEREVRSADDMAIVSGILWKRLDEGIGLAADATVRYVLSNPSGALTAANLSVDSPYNTRKYRGLPPGPISNPGLGAIIAAVRPSQSEYYYYLHTADGQTIFARTNEEHNVNKAKYLR